MNSDWVWTRKSISDTDQEIRLRLRLEYQTQTSNSEKELLHSLGIQSKPQSRISETEAD
jgi:hypothetical protein